MGGFAALTVVVVGAGDGGEGQARALAAHGATLILTGDADAVGQAAGRLRAELAAAGARVAVFVGDDDATLCDLGLELFGEEPVRAAPGASPEAVLGRG